METQELINVLNENHIIWWLDSGSLLGMAREGEFIKHDHDIDIGCLCSESDFSPIIEFFTNKGFRVVKFYWKNNLYKCKLVPLDYKSYKYILDFQFYVQKENMFCCPQMVFKEKLSFSKRLQKKKLRFTKSNVCYKECTFTKKLLYKLFIKPITKIKMDTKNQLFNLYIWRIKDDYVLSPMTTLNGFRAFMDYESYLKCRYGNWLIPATKWNFVKDDLSLSCTNKIEIDELYGRKKLKK